MAEDWNDDYDDLDEGSDQGSQRGRKPEDAAAQIRRLKKELKDAKAELTPLKEFQVKYEAEQKAAEVGKVFETVKLNPAQAKLFLSENPDAEVTPEAVVAWAKSYGITPNLASEEDADEGDEASDEASDSTGFAPIQTSEGAVPAPKVKKMTAKELFDLSRRDPAAAERAMREGKADVFSNEAERSNTFQPSKEDIDSLWD